MFKKILSQVRDPLYKNSFFIMLSSITNAGLVVSMLFGFSSVVIKARNTTVTANYFK